MLDRLPGRLAAAFVLFASIGSALFATQMPPFHHPDEPNHMLRIAQISRGGLIGQRQGPSASGGSVDTGLLGAIAQWMPIHTARDPDFRYTAAALERIRAVGWTGTRAFVGFPNTSVYPPLLYAPAALGLSLGRAARMKVGDSMLAARLASAAAAIPIGAAAVAMAGSAAPWLFALLTLPMATAQISAAAPDGLMLVLAALAAGLFASALRGERAMTLRSFAAAVVALSLVILAKPAYAPLALTILALPGVSLRARLAGLAGAVVPAVLWWAMASAVAMVELDHGVRVDSAAQLAGLLQQPGRIAEVGANTWRMFGGMYGTQFIGVFGWYEVNLPAAYRSAAWAVLGLAALLLLLGARRDADVGGAPALRWAVCLAGTVGAVALVFLSLYLTWSEVGLGHVDGVQGRYFYPIAAFLPCLVPALTRGMIPLRLAGLAILVAFPVLSLVVSLQRILFRYYAG